MLKSAHVLGDERKANRTPPPPYSAVGVARTPKRGRRTAPYETERRAVGRGQSPRSRATGVSKYRGGRIVPERRDAAVAAEVDVLAVLLNHPRGLHRDVERLVRERAVPDQPSIPRPARNARNFQKNPKKNNSRQQNVYFLFFSFSSSVLLERT